MSLSTENSRISVRKTYKNFVAGQFPRSESGRVFEFKTTESDVLINLSLSSRKDVRDAVTAAHAGFDKWKKTTAYNRGQILYRVAEMMESRKLQLLQDLQWQGLSLMEAQAELNASIDRCLHYAGWSDKYQQLFGAINPVASSHFNFTTLEPMGVVGILAPRSSSLLGLLSLLLPAIVGGNAVVTLASEELPLCAVSLSEILATSDLPAGVVNILTGRRGELLPSFATHMDIACVAVGSASKEELQTLEAEAAHSVKRIRSIDLDDWISAKGQGPHYILDFQEAKTTWHPVGL
jgi:acyl-CoA reductase-like NAD-dependent aldehyde dehydrogenase